MSTSVHDVPSAVAVAAAYSPTVETADAIGPAIDLVDADGPCFAIQIVGVVAEGTTVAGQLEQSANASSGWTAISGGAFAAVTETEDVQTLRFTPTARYVRWVADISAGLDPSAVVAVIVGRQKKTF